MTDAPARPRPLSPHLTIYRPQITSGLSILHRMTGVALLVSAMLVVWWFLAAAGGRDGFEFADGLLTSWLGRLVLLLSSVALWYHFANGIRHLIWDAGFGFELDQVRLSAIAVAVVTAVMTLVTLVVAWV